jgi:SSS family transporter
MHGLDLAVIVVYLGAVTAWGSWLGRGARGGGDYFLGGRELPWWAVMCSIVATETSTLTFLSIPGVAYLGDLTFLQLAFGYLAGRVVVSLVLLPSYHRGELRTAYALLEGRFGVGARRSASALFMVTRLLADSVRLFATAIPLALMTGWSYPVSILVIGALTSVYTVLGGIRGVVWVDALQLGFYLVAAGIACAVIEGLAPGGWSGALEQALAEGKLRVINPETSLTVPYTIWAGLFGGAFLSMASHGTDQLMVQRLLSCRDLGASRRALVGSGVLVIGQFALFLLLGVGLWAVYQGRAFARPDEVFSTFIVQELPPGLTGLLVAGVFSAAMSSLSSSIHALASATAYDFWAPLRGIAPTDPRILPLGRALTVVWSILLVGGAILFIPLSTRTAAVEVALAVAGVVYGGLLGAFLLGAVARGAHARGVMVGMFAGVGVVAAVWLAGRIGGEPLLAWPWFVPLGTFATVVVGASASAVLPRPPSARGGAA